MSDKQLYVNEISDLLKQQSSVSTAFADTPVPIKLSLPGYMNNLWKEAYNRSTYGLVDQLVNKKQRYDLSGFEQGTLFDVAATTFAIVLDLPTFAIGGGITKMGVKPFVKFVGKENIEKAQAKAVKLLAENGARPDYVNRVNKQLTETFITKGDRLINEAGGLAVLSGTHDMLYQKINEDDVNFAQSVNQALLGGASIGFAKFGGVAASNVVGKTAPKVASKTLEFGGEVVGFTQPYTFAEGNLLPSPHDLAHTAGVIGGVKIVAGGLQKFGTNINKKIQESERRFGNRDLTSKEKTILEEQRQLDAFDNLSKQEPFYDKEGNGVYVIGTSKDSVKFRDFEGKVEKEIGNETFYKEYSLKPDVAPDAVLNQRIKDGINELVKNEPKDWMRENKIRSLLYKYNRRFGSNYDREMDAMAAKQGLIIEGNPAKYRRFQGEAGWEMSKDQKSYFNKNLQSITKQESLTYLTDRTGKERGEVYHVASGLLPQDLIVARELGGSGTMSGEVYSGGFGKKGTEKIATPEGTVFFSESPKWAQIEGKKFEIRFVYDKATLEKKYKLKSTGNLQEFEFITQGIPEISKEAGLKRIEMKTTPERLQKAIDEYYYREDTIGMDKDIYTWRSPSNREIVAFEAIEALGFMSGTPVEKYLKHFKQVRDAREKVREFDAELSYTERADLAKINPEYRKAKKALEKLEARDEQLSREYAREQERLYEKEILEEGYPYEVESFSYYDFAQFKESGIYEISRPLKDIAQQIAVAKGVPVGLQSRKSLGSNYREVFGPDGLSVRAKKVPGVTAPALQQMGRLNIGLTEKGQARNIDLNYDLGLLTPKEKYQLAREIDADVRIMNWKARLKALDLDTKVDQGIFAKWYDDVTIDKLPKAFGLKVSPVRTPESIVRRNGADPRAKILLEDIQAFNGTRTIEAADVFNLLDIPFKDLKKLDKKQREEITRELETLEYNQLSDMAKKFRDAYDFMWKKQLEVGNQPADFLQKYAPRSLKWDIQEALTEIQYGILKEKPKLRDFIDGVSNNKDSMDFLKNKLEFEIKNNSNKGVRDYLKVLNERYGKDYYESFVQLDRDLNSIYSKSFHNVKKERQSYIEWDKDKNKYSYDIFETDAVANIINYINRHSESMALTQLFGKDLTRAKQQIRTLEANGDMLSANALTQTLARITGRIEVDPSMNYNPKIKNMFRDFTSWIVGTKIGGGTATIVNFTQPGISSLLSGNYAVGLKSYAEYFGNVDRAKLLRQAGLTEGTNALNHMEVLSGVKAPSRVSEKIANKITTLSGFNWINRFNGYTSGSVGVDMMNYLNSVAMGKSGLLEKVNLSARQKDAIINQTIAGKTRQAWAKDKLYNDFGITFNGENLTTKQLAQGAIRYSRNTQLQRDHSKELLWMTDPRFRPFVTLKSFPLKQAKFLKDTLKRELSYGNVMPVLRLAFATNALGYGVLYAYDAISKILSGRDDYDFRQMDEFVDRLAAVGATGVMGDILAAESQAQNLRYQLTPVIVSDIEKLLTATSRLYNDIGDFGVSGALQRAPVNFGRLLGSNLNNVAKRFETNTQREGKLKYQRTQLNKQVIKLVYEGREDKARKIIKNWNTANPDYPLLEPNAADVYEFIIKKAEKRQEP